MKKIVVFTGAGVSAESGLGTFRDSDGLWEKYRIEDVCTHEAWLRNPQLCVDFYNARRRDVLNARPNAAHEAIARLQQAIPGRPYIVFFGEGVPYFTEACNIAATADILVVVGTSLNVYPAASLLHYAPEHAQIIMVDPGDPQLGAYASRVQLIREPATTGVPKVVEQLISRYA